MYNIGDKIVYPMHGAGVIEAIEEKEFLGKKQKYYIMKMPLGDMKVMIPVNNVEDIGIREIIGTNVGQDVLTSLSSFCEDVNSNWNKRYRENMMKIKTGNTYEVAKVVKTLIERDRTRGLSTGERKMLQNAKLILISELVLANVGTEAEIMEAINR